MLKQEGRCSFTSLNGILVPGEGGVWGEICGIEEKHVEETVEKEYKEK